MIRELPASTYDAVDRAMGRVITLFVDSVDSALEAVPNPIPSGGQLRTTRSNQRENLTAGVNRIRKPVLAGIGAADWLAERLVPQSRQPEPDEVTSAPDPAKIPG